MEGTKELHALNWWASEWIQWIIVEVIARTRSILESEYSLYGSIETQQEMVKKTKPSYTFLQPLPSSSTTPPATTLSARGHSTLARIRVVSEWKDESVRSGESIGNLQYPVQIRPVRDSSQTTVVLITPVFLVFHYDKGLVHINIVSMATISLITVVMECCCICSFSLKASSRFSDRTSESHRAVGYGIWLVNYIHKLV